MNEFSWFFLSLLISVFFILVLCSLSFQLKSVSVLGLKYNLTQDFYIF